jgi:hypothetical protein
MAMHQKVTVLDVPCDPRTRNPETGYPREGDVKDKKKKEDFVINPTNDGQRMLCALKRATKQQRGAVGAHKRANRARFVFSASRSRVRQQWEMLRHFYQPKERHVQ